MASTMKLPPCHYANNNIYSNTAILVISIELIRARSATLPWELLPLYKHSGVWSSPNPLWLGNLSRHSISWSTNGWSPTSQSWRSFVKKSRPPTFNRISAAPLCCSLEMRLCLQQDLHMPSLYPHVCIRTCITLTVYCIENKKRGKFHFIHISTHACTGRLKKLTQHFPIFSACYIFSMHSFMKDMCMYKKQDLFLLQSIFTRNTFHTCTYQHIHVWSSISCFILFIQEYVCTKADIISLNIYKSLLLCYMCTINN